MAWSGPFAVSRHILLLPGKFRGVPAHVCKRCALGWVPGGGFDEWCHGPPEEDVGSRGFDLDTWIRPLCALVVAGGAAYASYVHQREFALQGGADGVSASLWPLSVDGLARVPHGRGLAQWAGFCSADTGRAERLPSRPQERRGGVWASLALS